MSARSKFQTTDEDREMAAYLNRINPFGDYRWPRNAREREIMRQTYENYQRRAARGKART